MVAPEWARGIGATRVTLSHNGTGSVDRATVHGRRTVHGPPHEHGRRARTFAILRVAPRWP